MPNYIGGDVIELTCSHPTRGDYRYQVKSGEAGTIDKGGIRNDDSSDGITGGGQIILKKSMVRGSFEMPVAVDLLGDKEMTGINDLAADAQPGTWLASCIGGAVFKLVGWPVGDLNADTSTAQMKIKIGGGKVEQIA